MNHTITPIFRFAKHEFAGERVNPGRFCTGRRAGVGPYGGYDRIRRRRIRTKMLLPGRRGRRPLQDKNRREAEFWLCGGKEEPYRRSTGRRLRRLVTLWCGSDALGRFELPGVCFQQTPGGIRPLCGLNVPSAHEVGRSNTYSLQMQKESIPMGCSLFGAAGQIRTADLILTKDALYLLSYSSRQIPQSFTLRGNGDREGT